MSKGLAMINLKRPFSLRIVRYALVGGVGIPINLVALAVFLHAFLSLGMVQMHLTVPHQQKGPALSS